MYAENIRENFNDVISGAVNEPKDGFIAREL